MQDVALTTSDKIFWNAPRELVVTKVKMAKRSWSPRTDLGHLAVAYGKQRRSDGGKFCHGTVPCVTQPLTDSNKLELWYRPREISAAKIKVACRCDAFEEVRSGNVDLAAKLVVGSVVQSVDVDGVIPSCLLRSHGPELGLRAGSRVRMNASLQSVV